MPARRLTIVAGVLAWALTAPPTRGQDDEVQRLYREASVAQASGDYATAARRYESIVALRPDMAEAFANLGNIYYQLNQPRQAATAYQRAIALKPGLAGPYFFLGMISFQSQSYTDALRYLSRAAELQPDNAGVLAYLGYTQYAQGKYREAAGNLEKAAERDNTDQTVYYHLSKSFGHLARASFDELKRRFPGSVYTSLARAHVLETEQDWKGAAEQYAAALDRMPANARLRAKAAWMADKASGKAPSAESGPFDTTVDGALRYLYRPPPADSVLREMEANQASIRARKAGTAESLYRAGEGYQILSYLASLRVIALDPLSYRARLLNAQLLESSGKEEEAIREYREVLRLEPQLPNVHFAIGSLLWKNQQFEEAHTELLAELKVSPHHPQALYELGDIELTAGDRKAAEEYYSQALRFAPDMVDARFALEKINTEAGRYQVSLEHLRRVIEIDPSDPTPHYRLAQVYRRMGKLTESQMELKTFEQMKAGGARNKE